MNTIARITAVVLIILGILVMLGGLALGVTGAVRSILGVASAARPLRETGVAGLLLVAYIFTHGLLVTGAGEGLYLLAGIASK
jgi:hypothetical protein